MMEDGCWWSAPMRKSIFLWLAVVLLVISLTSGDCVQGARQYEENNIWRASACETCVCQQGVSVCSQTKCTDVKCDEGKSLVIPTGQCCPQCLQPKSSCQVNETTHQHGETWKISPCQNCLCVNGKVNCSIEVCDPPSTCASGDEVTVPHNQCCPTCVPTGRQCWYNAQTYKDGEVFDLINCTICQCQNGEIQCYLKQCPVVTCVEGQMSVLLPNTCCRQCIPRGCVDGNKQYQNGEQWEPNRCKVCRCDNDKRVCVIRSCPKVKCKNDELELRKRDQCCPSCVALGKSCLGSGKEYMNREVWNPSPCSFCVCDNGNVSCSQAVCEIPSCSKGQHLVKPADQCCLVCASSPGICRYKEGTYKDGQQWKLDLCTLCRCENGQVSCYETSCTRCPTGVISKEVPGQCCPRCESRCSEECLTCTNRATNCSACRVSSHWLEDGQCVSGCSSGFFADAMSRVCQKCHQTCAECSGLSIRHCTACSHPMYLKENLCVMDCGLGYFIHRQECRECHTSCGGCNGAGQHKCTSCSDPLAFFMDGKCVSNCEASYYAAGQNCTACESSCKTCGPDSPNCSSCSRHLKLKEGTCVVQCGDGYYDNTGGHCEKCHQSCSRCSGSLSVDCLACVDGLILQNGYCVPSCSDGYYSHSGVCLACDDSCHTCEGPGNSACTSCPGGTALTSTGMCVVNCGESMFASEENICADCHSSCQNCSGSSDSDCMSCLSPHVLRSGRCISNCPDGEYNQSGVCKSCHGSCLTCTSGSSSNCSTCRAPAQLTTEGQCQTSCASTEYEDRNGSCHSCHSSCLACVVSSNGSGSACVDCNQNRFLKGEQCVSDCGVGYYPSSGRCTVCDASCLTCNGWSKTSCQSCPSGFSVSLGGRCVTKCPTGEYSDGKGQCHKCDGSCLTCSGSATACLECRSPLHILKYGRCMERCGDGFFISEGKIRQCKGCHSTCYQCSGIDECLACYSPLLVKAGKCVQHCGNGFYKDSSICKPCSSHCAQCDSVDYCRRCQYSYLLYIGECVRNCPRGFFANSVARSCTTCSSKCADCRDSSTCVSCLDGTYLLSGQCVSSCGGGYYQNIPDRICEANVHHPVIMTNGTVVVAIGGSVFLDPLILDATDSDTDQSKLLFQVVRLPTNGQLVKTSSSGTQALSTGGTFNRAEMMAGIIQFVHNAELALEGSMSIRVSDRQLTSDVVTVIIRAISMYAPVVITNDGLTVEEFEMKTISMSSLDVTDQDNLEQVTITAVSGPHYGQLLRARVKTQSFTVNELRRRMISYVHRFGQSPVDFVLFQASDGTSVVNFLFQINITLTDNDPPVLVTNRQLVVREGSAAALTTDFLAVHDIDSDDRALHLKITRRPQNGKLVIRKAVPDGGVPPGWAAVAGTDEMQKEKDLYHQEELASAQVYYEHSGTETTSDSFGFEVWDKGSPPNGLLNQEFLIVIVPVDDETPRLDSSLSLPLQIAVDEGSTVTITRQQLAYEDPDTDNRKLQYTIVSGPQNGYIEMRMAPNVSVTHFTQADVNAGRVLLRMAASEIGVRNIKTEIRFTVSDGKNSLSHQTLKVLVMPVNSQPPEFETSQPLVVDEGGKGSIGLNQLSVSDPDTELADLMYTVAQTPEHGHLTLIRGSSVVTLLGGGKFSVIDIVSRFLKYVHDGSETTSDNFRIGATDGKYTVYTTVDVQITPVDEDSPDLAAGVSLQLTVAENSSEYITYRVLAATDSDSENRLLLYTLIREPSQGSLQVRSSRLKFDNISTGGQFTQGQINNFDIQFVTMGEIGPSEIRDSFVVSVTDKAGNQLSSVEVNVVITPVNSVSPKLTVGSNVVVVEGGRTSITESNLHVTDSDTVDEELICHITVLPHAGFLENIGTVPGSERTGRGLAINAFTVDDLRGGFIYYEQNQHEGVEPVSDFFEMLCSDGVHQSAEKTVQVSIQLINDERPEVETDILFCSENAGVAITNLTVWATDLDTPDEQLLFILTSQPQYGEVRKRKTADELPFLGTVMEARNTFTIDDLYARLIVYTHNGRLSNTDRIQLAVSDGTLSTDFVVRIVIAAVDDETPRLTVNTGLKLKLHKSALVLPENLHATDIDSEESELTFILKTEPTLGSLQLEKRRHITRLSPSGVNSFKQEDIDSGRLQYVHSGTSGIDTFRFDVVDPNGNKLLAQDFVIYIEEDIIPPAVMTNAGLQLKEGESRKITTQELSGTDSNSNDADLMFFVDVGPIYGQLLRLGDGSIVDKFTQSDLAAVTVIYRHLNEEESDQDQFQFTLSDGANNVSMMFFITIQPVDDSLPLLTNEGLRITEGSVKTITLFELEAVDADTKPGNLQFLVVSLPQHGRLERADDSSMFVGVVTFTMQEILDNKIRYQHDGSNTIRDAFTFTVSDGTNVDFQFVDAQGQLKTTRTAQMFSISITAVDDGAPRLLVNTGLQSLSVANRVSFGIIGKRQLLATDDDTEDSTLVYTVTTPPIYGYIIRCHRSRCTESSPHVSSFTQKDVTARQIAYVANSINNTKDQFEFSVSDQKPNILPDQSFQIQWSYVVFEFEDTTSALIVGETDGTAVIRVRRYGNLHQESFVVCKTQQELATSRHGVGPRKGRNDYEETVDQVQFGVLEEVKTCSVRIIDDDVYEGATEYFLVLLDFPVQTLVGMPQEAKVIINDTEDEPKMSFFSSLVGVGESAHVVNVRMTRTGDLSKATYVVCYTDGGGTAQGSTLGSLESGSDYVTRSRDSSSSVVVFRTEDSEAMCQLLIIDDTLYELAETIVIKLGSPVGGALGEIVSSVITILGPNDEPQISLSHQAFTFGEDANEQSIDVIRSGVDLQHMSMVWCLTRRSNPASAEPGTDFESHSTQVVFAPKETVKPCRFIILDDAEQPKLEGNETFVIALHIPIGGSLLPPYQAVVTIDDTVDDVPKVSFAEIEVEVDEQDGNVMVPVTRSGDLSVEVTVRCYTRAKTATVEEDYRERSNTDDSIIRYLPGEASKTCDVTIVNDPNFEPEEVFYLYLGSVDSSVGGQIEQNRSTVTIKNPEDVPTVQFEHSVYEVKEPVSSSHKTDITVNVIRTGDTNMTSRVRCSTRDGLAVSGLDYEPQSELLVFSPGQRQAQVTVQILYSEKTEWEESFTIVLNAESAVNAVLGAEAIAHITIIDHQRIGGVVAIDIPKIISLLDYDQAQIATETPSPGYPVVCLTPCDSHHPQFEEVRALCESNGVLANLTNFKWEVSPPADADGIQQPFSQIDADTVFTSTKEMVLDSIYLCPRCRVRCAAQPSDTSGALGSWYYSNPVIVGSRSICHSHNETVDLLKAESFIANLDYIDTRDPVLGNHMKISIEVPHRDGMLPVLSTRNIVNLKWALSKSSYRHQHACSNLLDYSEHDGLPFGFINAISHGEEPHGPGYDFPHQFDSEMRGASTLRLYQHLNLKSCLWTFEGYFHISELRDICGGEVTTGFAIEDQVSSKLTVMVPLHVSYVYHTPPVGWIQFGHSTEMSFSFTYSNILFRGGVGAEGIQQGRLQVLQAAIRPSDGRFVITFTTEAKFRGQFVLTHQSDDSVVSYVDAPASVGVDFELVELFHENSFDSPTQVWQTSSLLSARDYTGTYSVYLIPCTVKSTDSYGTTERNVHCTPHDPVRFTMPIMFSQVIPPVPEKYKLNTLFMLHNSLDVFLSNPFQENVDLNQLDYNGKFGKGDVVYGRVMWNPTQDLHSPFRLRIESVYLCSGKDGFVPYYDPEGQIFKGEPQYGCLHSHSNLAYSFKLIDMKHPDTVDKHFKGMQFQAQLASDNPSHHSLSNIPGVDGFSMLTDPLYTVEAGRQWFLQIVYSIGGANGGINKRSVDNILAVSPLKRSMRPTLSPDSENGTDIRFFETESTDTARKSQSFPGAATGGIVAFLVILFVIVGVICVRYHHRKTETKEEGSSSSKVEGKRDKKDREMADSDIEYDEDSEEDEKQTGLYEDSDYDHSSIGSLDQTHNYSDNEQTEV